MVQAATDPHDEAFFRQMWECRDPYRRLGDCFHAVVGQQATAIDIGCGIGLQTKRLQELGWEIIGAEYSPVAIELREPGVHIAPIDLTSPVADGNKKFSCVICTETGEHIPASYASEVAGNIASRAKDFIIWSAAAPGQEWEGHINLQPPSYWLKRFRILGWKLDEERTAKLRYLMQKHNAQHVLGRDNFCVLVPDGKPLHMTITSTALNAERWIGTHLASVASQTFRNYDHVVIDAKSDDQTASVVKCELNHQTRLIENTTRLSALENCWEIWKTLPPEEVIVWLDGDDWLAHDKALEVVAHEYGSESEPWLTYGQFMFADGEVGFASPYPLNVQVRQDHWRATHLKTFRAGLVQQLSDKDLKDSRGNFLELAIDKVIMWPLLEMAAQHYACIYQVLSVYNYEASWAASKTQAGRQVELDVVTELRQRWTKPPLKTRPW